VLVEGDKISGSIEKIADSTWQTVSSFTAKNGSTFNTTLTSRVGDFFYNYADVTLEV